jgi:succinate dehydrogenase/fumarate reductase flavoprotein subunit
LRDAGADPFATNASSLPGLYAAGDVRRGGTRRVAGAVGDGALAIKQIHEYLAATRAGGAPIRQASKMGGYFVNTVQDAGSSAVA